MEDLIKVKSVGIELEGGIDIADLDTLKNNYKNSNALELSNDGSVFVEGKDISDIEIKFYSHDLERLFEFIKFVFDKCDFKQNKTCGNHVHMVFNNMQLALALLSFGIVQQRFFNEYVKKFANRKKYMARINNKYCLMGYDEHSVIEQLRNKSKTCLRYRAINLNSFNLHRTIEFRILPHFSSAKEAVSSVAWLINTAEEVLNYFLKNNALLHEKTITICSNTNYYNINKVEIAVFELKNR